MGCHNSKVCSQVCRKKKKSKVKQQEEKNLEPNVKESSNAQDGSGKLPLEELKLPLEELGCGLEEYEWQLKILHGVLAASGCKERDGLLKTSLHGDLCALVHSITEKVKAETAVELKALHEEQTKTATEEYHNKTQELQCLHDEEKKSLCDTHQAAENALKDKMEMLTTDLNVFHKLKRRVDKSTLKRDLQRNIQTHGSPGAFWEQEQESLLFVIELRSERLQEHGNKLLQMEALVEKNLSLEDQVIHALQQNEDLRVRIENYQSLIHQLSKEESDLQEVLEKQSLQLQRLTQEKEELLFKLLHQRDSCSSFHMAPIMPEVSPS